MSRRLKLEAWLHTRREAWRAEFVRGPATGFLFEFVSFGVKQAWACLFGGLMLALLVGSFLFYPANAAARPLRLPHARSPRATGRHVGGQARNLGEARVIFAFHVVGTLMEIFKTAPADWIYPNPHCCALAGVPLFSGFMYAAVGSYIARVWRITEFRFVRFPSLWLQALLAVAV